MDHLRIASLSSSKRHVAQELRFLSETATVLGADRIEFDGDRARLMRGRISVSTTHSRDVVALLRTLQGGN